MKHSTTAQSAIVVLRTVLAEVRTLPETDKQIELADTLVKAYALLHVVRDEQASIEARHFEPVTA